jgi:hypothetical protein
MSEQRLEIFCFGLIEKMNKARVKAKIGFDAGFIWARDFMAWFEAF